jgi:hypothetical protein
MSGDLTVKGGWSWDEMAYGERSLSRLHTGASDLFNGTHVDTIF